MKKILVVTCASFTTIVLLFSFVERLKITPALNGSVVWQLFLMSLSVSAGMHLVYRLEEVLDISSFVFDVAVRVVVCYVVVLLEGSSFQMFSFGWKAVAVVSPVLIPTIFITYLISYFSLVECADSINSILNKEKAGEKHENH